jgi:TPR repeat protein
VSYLKIFKLVAFSAILAMCGSLVIADDFDQGIIDFNKGDISAAVNDYSIAAEKGDTRAMVMLGRMYDEGQGVPQNYSEAFKWFRQAVEHGADLSFNIAVIYQDGRGVLQDNVRAHMWYNISSAREGNDGIAAKWRDWIAKKMTLEDISKAQTMAQVCMSSGYKDCGW